VPADSSVDNTLIDLIRQQRQRAGRAHARSPTPPPARATPSTWRGPPSGSARRPARCGRPTLRRRSRLSFTCERQIP
jgi:hypothetical protein